MFYQFGKMPLELMAEGSWTNFEAQMKVCQVYFLWVNQSVAEAYEMPTAERYLCMVTKATTTYGKALAIKADGAGVLYQRTFRSSGWSAWTEV